MCQTRCGESRLTATDEGIAVNKITSKYISFATKLRKVNISKLPKVI